MRDIDIENLLNTMRESQNSTIVLMIALVRLSERVAAQTDSNPHQVLIQVCAESAQFAVSCSAEQLQEYLNSHYTYGG